MNMTNKKINNNISSRANTHSYDYYIDNNIYNNYNLNIKKNDYNNDNFIHTLNYFNENEINNNNKYQYKNAINNYNSIFNNVKSKTNKSSNNINNIQVNKYLKDLSENASLEYNDDIMKKTTPKQKNKFNKKNPNNEILNDKINFNNINIGINNNNFIIDNNKK